MQNQEYSQHKSMKDQEDTIHTHFTISQKIPQNVGLWQNRRNMLHILYVDHGMNRGYIYEMN